MSLRIVVAWLWMMISCSTRSVDSAIGINWGRQSVTTLVPSMVVDILLQNQIKNVKLFNSDTNPIRALRHTNIGVTVTISNPKVLQTRDSILQWVQRTIDPFHETVNFRYVSVGNNAFGMAKSKNMTIEYIVERVKLTQMVLNELGYSRIKVVISHSFYAVLNKNITVPSEAEFAPHLLRPMQDLLWFMKLSGAPFIYETFPISLVKVLNFDFDFAFSDDRSNMSIIDNGVRYNNLFDFIHDSFIWALRKAGATKMDIIVGQTGWPTDGCEGANAAAAQRYWKALLPRVVSNRGTPARPGVPIDIFVHSITDEHMNSAYEPFTRHWGIYRANGEPKYKIDLTGRGRDVFPPLARGTSLMPSRWCVFNNNMSDPMLVRNQFDFACKNADCTSLAPGGSCGMLTYSENISYAFNAFFQSSFQSERACVFENLGKVVMKDPGRDGCVFSVEVVEGHQPAISFVLP